LAAQTRGLLGGRVKPGHGEDGGRLTKMVEGPKTRPLPEPT